MPNLARISLCAVVLVFAILNLIPRQLSVAFEEQSFPEAFVRSWGWPFSAMSLASTEGVDLVDASVVMNGTFIWRDLFSGKYPHLAVNSTFATVDLGIFGLIVLATYAATRKMNQYQVARKPGRTDS